METVESLEKIPRLSADSVHIWGVHIPEIGPEIARLHEVLNPEEQGKAARFKREIDRNTSISTRGALRILLAAYTEIPPAELTFSYCENGKPSIESADISFNVSHSGDWAVLAFGMNRKIGVDIEQIRQSVDIASIAGRYFSPAEIALIETAENPHDIFFQLWSRKEAYIKAIGSALFKSLGSFSVPLDETGLPDSAEKEGWFYRRLEAGSKYAATVVTDRPVGNLTCFDFNRLNWHSAPFFSPAPGGHPQNS